MKNYFKIDKNILYFKNKKIEFDYDITEVLEFDTSIVIYIAPARRSVHRYVELKASVHACNKTKF